jgi:hypothetical protein
MIRSIPIHLRNPLPASGSHLFAGGNIERQLELILELDRPAGGGNWPNLVIALAERKISRRPEHITVEPNADTG